MRFLRREPCAALRPFVRCFWQLEQAADEAQGAETVIPDGCMELIVHFGARFDAVHGDVCERHPRGLVGGQIERAIQIRATGPVGMLGARFEPAGARALLGVPMDSVAGRTVDLVDLAGGAGRRLVERVVSPNGSEARFEILEAFLMSRAAEGRGIDALALASIATLTRCGGRIAVSELAAALGVGTRRLNRTLCREVGLGAKAYARIARVQHALTTIQRNRGADLTRVAHDAGYFDQSHFSRDFKSLCGASPSAFVAEPHALVDAFQ